MSAALLLHSRLLVKLAHSSLKRAKLDVSMLNPETLLLKLA
jgi:hypothetical protein